MCPPQGKTLLLAFTDPWMIYTCAVALSLYVCVCVCLHACVSVRNHKHGLTACFEFVSSHTRALISHPVSECSPSLIGMCARMSLFATLIQHVCVCNYLLFTAAVSLFIACMQFISGPAEVNTPNIFIFVSPTCPLSDRCTASKC